MKDDLKKLMKEDVDSTVDITKKSWERMAVAQKKEFLKNRGFNTSFAEAKTLKELIKRDGGMVAKDFHYVVKEWRRRNPERRINWD